MELFKGQLYAQTELDLLSQTNPLFFFFLTNITIIHSVASKTIIYFSFHNQSPKPNSVLSSTPQKTIYLPWLPLQGTISFSSDCYKSFLTVLPHPLPKALLVGCPYPSRALSTATRTSFQRVNLIFYLLKFGRDLLTVVLKIKIQVFIGLWGPVTCGPSSRLYASCYILLTH